MKGTVAPSGGEHRAADDAGAAPLRVLYSFPQKLGAERVATTAWHQVRGLVAAGADVTVFPGAVHRPVAGAKVRPTLARGRARLPYRAVGMTTACELHDRIVARRLPALVGSIDVVHAWPVGARRTLAVARALGIPTFLERPNAHTRYAYDVVAAESARLGIRLPRGAEHAFDARVLRIEEQEYRLAHRLLCPSDFVVRTFLEAGHPREKLVRHTYGVDPTRFRPATERSGDRPFTVLFAGYAAVRKGLHLALDAWSRSSAARDGRFLVAGGILPVYRDVLAAQLAGPGVHLLGQRDDVAELMATSDVLVLPSLEEGFGLVCVEAMASGCVPLVSDACTEVCRHGVNALVHRVADVDALAGHLSLLHDDREALARLRSEALRTASGVTWEAAGRRLMVAYREGCKGFRRGRNDVS